MKTWDWNNFNLYTTVMDIVRNIWVIFLAGVIGFFGCYTYYSYIRPVEYTSEMTMAINLSGYTTNSTSTSLARTVSIAEVLKDVFGSSTLRTIVAEKMAKTGANMTGTIEAVQMEETNLVTVSVTDSSPVKAYETLQIVKDSYGDVTDYVFSNAIISVLKSPNVPTRPSNVSLYISRSAVVGILLMMVTVFLIVVMSYYRDTLKNISDVEGVLDSKLFGVVAHEEFRSGLFKKTTQALMLNGPFVSYEFSESFRKMAIKLESLKRTKHIRSIMVTSVSENEGKTTTSVNLALALQMEGNSVVLFDADLKKPAVYRFFKKTEFQPETETREYLKGNITLQETMKKDPSSGLTLLAGKRPLRDSSDVLNGAVFRETLRELENQFDFVVVDTPPSGYAVDAEIVSSLTSCALLVTRQDFTDAAEIKDYLTVLNGNTYVVGCMLNDYHQMGKDKTAVPAANPGKL